MSDLIAEVEILKKIDEIDEPYCKTLFSASVIKIFKGEIDDNKNKEIIIMQEGNSEWIYNNMRLFEAGEKYILILKKAKGYENTYWIIAGDANIYTIETLDNKEYAIKNSIKDEKLKKIQIEEMESIVKRKWEKKLSKQERIKNIQVMEKESFENELIATIKEKSDEK
ncbi:MAG: hypothetical protein HPY74_02450 [Firmicutes bacterium]|nr:hypothetical protein [Bacillota bacterium]